MSIIMVPTQYYQQFDADFALEVPAESYGGWRKELLELNLQRTAVVVMHAWDCGTREQFPGWHRAVEYIPRSYAICDTVLPTLLKTVRKAGMNIFHVVKPKASYYKNEPGYLKTLEQTVKRTVPLQEDDTIEPDPVYKSLLQFKAAHSFPGNHNRQDIVRGNEKLDFPEGARPLPNEGIAESSEQLLALCQSENINHLIYTGFAINGCLWTSPGGMIDMQRKGLICSAVREAVTAIENKETAREERNKELALWYVALMFGFVYDIKDLTEAIEQKI